MEKAKEVICARCTDTRHWARAEDIYGDGVLRHWLKYGDHEINRPCHASQSEAEENTMTEVAEVRLQKKGDEIIASISMPGAIVEATGDSVKDALQMLAEGEHKVTNPPDFVMYVVMVKPPHSKVFDPCWALWGDEDGVYVRGFARKRDANAECKKFRARYGQKNAYVQQYGPYK